MGSLLGNSSTNGAEWDVAQRQWVVCQATVQPTAQNVMLCKING